MKKDSSHRKLILLISPENESLCLAALRELQLKPVRKIRNFSGLWITAKTSMENGRPLMLRLWERRHPKTGRRIFPTMKLQTHLKGREDLDFRKTLKVFTLGSTEKIPDHKCLWVDPRGAADERRRDTLYVNYGEAFGAGSHPSTQMSAEMLCKTMAKFRKPKVLDLGCGTGVLSMAAVRWGAGTVWAVDNDPTALETARRNFKTNRTPGMVLRERTDGCRVKFQIIVLNVNVKVAILFKETVSRRMHPKGFAILGGLEHRDVQPVLQAYSDFVVVERRNDDRWANLLIKKP